jgi:hypothetical protein
MSQRKFHYFSNEGKGLSAASYVFVADSIEEFFFL